MIDESDIKTVLTAIGTVAALFLGIYNIRRSNKISNLMDSLSLDDKRHELLRTAVEAQTINIYIGKSLLEANYKARLKIVTVPNNIKQDLQNTIDRIKRHIADNDSSISRQKQIITIARELTAETIPTHELIREINARLGEVRASVAESLMEQAYVSTIITQIEQM